MVWLRADVAVLAARVGAGAGRPLLEGGPAEALARLAAERAPIYAELADLAFDVDRMSPPQVVDRIVAALHDRGIGRPVMHELRVDLGDRSYPVLVGPGARHRLTEVLPAGAHRAAIVTQEAMPWTVDAGVEQRTFSPGRRRGGQEPASRSRSCAGASPAGG